MKKKNRYYIDDHIDNITAATLHTKIDGNWYFLNYDGWVVDSSYSGPYKYYSTEKLLNAFRKSTEDDSHVVAELEIEMKKDLYEEILSDEG